MLDGDIAAYRPASAVDGRMYILNGQKGIWKYKKDVVKACGDLGADPKDIELVFQPEPLNHAFAAMKSQMVSIRTALLGHHDRLVWETYLTKSGSNFRYDINPQYKGNRVGVRRPEHLGACKEYLEKNFNAVYWENLEADDALTIRATELKAEGKPYVIVSIDKDLKQMDGDHLDFLKDTYVNITVEQGRELLWKQVLTGDTTDAIYTPYGLGPKYADKWLEDVDWVTVTDEELFVMCTEAYISKLKKVKDHADVRCWVEQTYNLVYLLRERPKWLCQ